MFATALRSNPRRSLATLVTVLAAGGVAVGSGADFTATTANAGNVITSGTLTQSNSKGSAAIVTGTNLKPGDSTTGTVTITNTGSLAGTFTLSELAASNAFQPGSLSLKVEDVTTATPVTVYSGEFQSAGTKALGSFAAGAARTYKFTVTLAQSAGNADQAKSASATFQWDATQTN